MHVCGLSGSKRKETFYWSGSWHKKDGLLAFLIVAVLVELKKEILSQWLFVGLKVDTRWTVSIFNFFEV